MIQNCTVRHPELEAGINQQQEATADAIREHASHRRKCKPGSTRKIKHNHKEEVYEGGVTVNKPVTTTTTRRNK